MPDLRAEPAKFYDLNPNSPDDVPFYLSRLPSPACSVLELRCGTGRVAIPIAAHCRFVYGIDSSEALLRIAMRYYYPEELVALVESHGFVVLGAWGGYGGEVFGEGPELVIEFGAEDPSRE